MDSLQKLEDTLDEVFDKKAPYRLPTNARKSLAGFMWVLALVFGVLQLWAAWGFWHLGHVTNQFVDYANSLSAAYGTGETVQHLGFIYYLSLIVLAVDAVLLLLATPGLKAFKKQGWNFLFYSLLVNLLYGVVRAFSDVGGGIGQVLWSLVASGIGAFFLFQIRSYFMGMRPAGRVGVEKAAPKTPTATKSAK
jgi:hypothetical protein